MATGPKERPYCDRRHKLKGQHGEGTAEAENKGHVSSQSPLAAVSKNCARIAEEEKLLIGKKYSYKSSLMMRTRENPAECLTSGENAQQQHHLDRYLRIPTGEKQREFSERRKKETLTGHPRNHIGERTFPLAECGKSFRYKSSLASHQSIHSKRWPYECLHRGKRFNQNVHLRRHERIHTGEKPFQCSQCEKRFNQRWHLLRHQKIHLGEKPFQCSQCKKRFNQRENLLRHQRIHTREEPYKCLQCGKNLCRRRTLTRHQRTHTAKSGSP